MIEQILTITFWLFVLVVILIFVAIHRGGELAKQAPMRRDQARYAEEQYWVQSGEWPLTLYRVYETQGELTADLARLKAMGYKVEWQEHVEEGVAVTYSLGPAYKKKKVRTG